MGPIMEPVDLLTAAWSSLFDQPVVGSHNDDYLKFEIEDVFHVSVCPKATTFTSTFTKTIS